MRLIIAAVLALLVLAGPGRAEDYFSTSGRVAMFGAYALEQDTVKEAPSLNAEVKLNGELSQWRLNSILAGGWDGSVQDVRKDHTLFKRFDKVYQSNTPFLEFKECYVERSFQALDFRVGIQRFAWGRLDEYPVNDLFNPWDYTQFILRPTEERKIGVPALSVSLGRADWSYQAVWVPWFVPYRLPKPDERWSPVPSQTIQTALPASEISAAEPDLPEGELGNGALGLRFQRLGEVDWALSCFHGFDPRPVFKTRQIRLSESQGRLYLDPGLVPGFHQITVIGTDAATVLGDFSLRAEAGYIFDRVFNIRQELWGYPSAPWLLSSPLNPIEHKSNSLDYGIAADYRLFEDGLVTLQAQQTLILSYSPALYDRRLETILWANLRVGWLNQKIETNLNLACNPEHGAFLTRPGLQYIFSDAWKAGLSGVWLNGPPQSLFGRYSQNDQIEIRVTYAW